jgi:hypothetical protein
MDSPAIIAFQSFAIVPPLNIEKHEYDRCRAFALPARLPFRAVQDYFVHGLGPSLIACTADTSDPRIYPTLRFALVLTTPFTSDGCISTGAHANLISEAKTTTSCTHFYNSCKLSNLMYTHGNDT